MIVLQFDLWIMIRMTYDDAKLEQNTDSVVFQHLNRQLPKKAIQSNNIPYKHFGDGFPVASDSIMAAGVAT